MQGGRYSAQHECELSRMVECVRISVMLPPATKEYMMRYSCSPDPVLLFSCSCSPVLLFRMRGIIPPLTETNITLT